MFTQKQIEEIILHGRFGSLSGQSTQEDITLLFGEPSDSQRRKSELICFYPSAEVIFSHGSLRQLTIKPKDQAQADMMDTMINDLNLETVDEVAPFFRCSRVKDKQNILINQSPSDGMRVISIALLFEDQNVTHSISLNVSQQSYHKLCSAANSKRISIEELCQNIIDQNIDNI